MFRSKKSNLPKKRDFDPDRGCLDAQWAWKNFGGLSVDQAFEKFCEHPEYYQEDFMWMGWKAFTFYFPVVDRFLRNADPEQTEDDSEAWILGCGIELQLNDYEKSALMRSLKIFTSSVHLCWMSSRPS